MDLKAQAKARNRQLAERKRAVRQAERAETERRKQVSAGLHADIDRGRDDDLAPMVEAVVEPVPEPRAPRAHGSARMGRAVTWIGPFSVLIAFVLAVGAFVVALGGRPVAVFDVLAPVCHLLVAGVGTTTATSSTLVTWGIGAVCWLALGFGLQASLARWARV